MNFQIVYPKDIDRLQRNSRVKIIDIRDQESFEEGHLPNAYNIPQDVTEDYEAILPKNGAYVLVCEHGGSSMQLARELGIKGYMVATVVGGYEGILKYQKKVVENN